MPVLIFDDAEPRVRALAAKMGWDERMAWGCVRCLWADSQNIGVWEASGDEILAWCRETDPGARQRLLEALQHRTIRFIEPTANGLFVIRGSKLHIMRKDAVSHQRKNAAEQRWEAERARRDAAKSESPEIKENGCEPHAGRTADANANAHAYAMPLQTTPDHSRPLQHKEIIGDAITTAEVEPKAALGAAASSKRTFKYSDSDMRAAHWFRDELAKENPLAVKLKRANLEAWADEFRKMRELDGHNPDDIATVALYVLQSEFWRPNIQSPSKLRDKWDTLTAQILNKKTVRGLK